MKSYQEEVQGDSFDWNAAIDTCIVLGMRTTPEMKMKAGSWVTCACGNQCAIIPRTDGRPVDRKLQELGLKFMYAIESSFLLKAEDILKAIETRSAKLIADEKNKRALRITDIKAMIKENNAKNRQLRKELKALEI